MVIGHHLKRIRISRTWSQDLKLWVVDNLLKYVGDFGLELDKYTCIELVIYCLPFLYPFSFPSVSDLMIALLGIPMDFFASFQFGWKMGEGPCVFLGFALTFLGKKKGRYYQFHVSLFHVSYL